MFSTIITLLVISLTQASPLTRDLVDNTQPFGANPISVSTVTLIGIQTSENSCSHRDLGFTGEINGQWYAIYGDCLWCAPGVTDPADDTEGFNGMVRDSVSLMTSNVLKPRDLNLNDDTPVPHQNQFVPFNESWGETQMYGFGGTSLCATDDYNEEGLLFYLVNANEAGIQGAGVAKVKVINGTPTVIERFSINNTGYWWPSSTNPCYGDVAAYRDPNSGYIYALGNPPSNLSGYAERQYVYQARVQYQDAFDLSKYEYWHGRDAGWQPTPLDISECNTETAVMWGVGQGQLTWSAHYNCYIFVHTQPATNKVVLRTAAKLEGPWSADVTVYEATLDSPGYIYAGVAHPYLDPSGKTLTISYTKLENVIEVIEVAFN